MPFECKNMEKIKYLKGKTKTDGRAHSNNTLNRGRCYRDNQLEGDRVKAVKRQEVNDGCLDFHKTTARGCRYYAKVDR